jgi:hypothetical protein
MEATPHKVALFGLDGVLWDCDRARSRARQQAGPARCEIASPRSCNTWWQNANRTSFTRSHCSRAGTVPRGRPAGGAGALGEGPLRTHRRQRADPGTLKAAPNDEDQAPRQVQERPSRALPAARARLARSDARQHPGWLGVNGRPGEHLAAAVVVAWVAVAMVGYLVDTYRAASFQRKHPENERAR